MSAKNTTGLSVLMGINITMHCKVKNWTQAELVEKLGIETDSLSRIERGIVAPRFLRIEEFARVLECSVADLFKTSE